MEKYQTRFNPSIQPMIIVFSIYLWLNAGIKPGLIFLIWIPFLHAAIRILDLSLSTFADYEELSVDQPICRGNARWKNDCNWCQCNTNGTASCTANSCGNFPKCRCFALRFFKFSPIFTFNFTNF